jgi:uncharacterized surface protein with fasciclin (FAS1) repeats
MRKMPRLFLFIFSLTAMLVLGACARPGLGIINDEPTATPAEGAPIVEEEGEGAEEATMVPPEGEGETMEPTTAATEAVPTSSPIPPTATTAPTQEGYTAIEAEDGADLLVNMAGLRDADTLLSTLIIAGLSETLREEGPFTVFVPTDEAFASMPPETFEALLRDTQLLTDVLLYHVVRGEVPASGLQAVPSIRTAQGEPINVSATDGSVQLNENASVIGPDIEASNGIIHVIDTVLLPPGLDVSGGTAEPAQSPEATTAPEGDATAPAASPEATAAPEGDTPTEPASTVAPTEATSPETQETAEPEAMSEPTAAAGGVAVGSEAAGNGIGAAPADSADTVFPLPESAQDVVVSANDTVDFQVNSGIDEVVAFYRDVFGERNMVEREGLTNIRDDSFTMVFDNWVNEDSDAVIVQGIAIDGSTSVSVEFRDI